MTHHPGERLGVRVVRGGSVVVHPRGHQVLQRRRGGACHVRRTRLLLVFAARRRLAAVQPGRLVHGQHRVYRQVPRQVRDALIHQVHAHVLVGQRQRLQRGRRRLQLHHIFVHESANSAHVCCIKIIRRSTDSGPRRRRLYILGRSLFSKVT